MGTVSYLVRRDLLRRWRSALFFALLVALGTGTTLAALAGARRNDTAFSRLLAPSLPADLMALPNEPGFDWDAVRDLPEVVAVAPFAVSGYTAEGFAGDQISFPSVTDDMNRTVERGILVKGRYFDHSRADEVMITPAAEKRGRHVGGRVKLRVAARDQIDDIDSLTFDNARGPEVDATIVGEVLIPWGAMYGPDPGVVFTTSAFYQQYKEYILPAGASGYENALVRLENGAADEAGFQRGIDRVAGHPVDLTLFSNTRKNVTRSTGFEAKSLYAFALVAATASIILIGLALGRMVAYLGPDLETLGAFGLTRRKRTRVGAGTPAIAGVLGVGIGVIGAWFVSDRFPIGVGKRVEPFPGRSFNAALLLGGGLVVAVLIVSAALLSAARQRVRAPHPERRSLIGRASANAPLPVALGTRLALERGQGRSAVAVRPAIIGAIVGVLGVVGVATFRSGLDGVDNGDFGQHYDAGTGTIGAFPLPDDTIPTLTADKDVEMVLDVPEAVVDFGASSVTLMGATEVKGNYGLTVLDGRAPVAADEIALSPRDRDRLHADVGDTVHANGRAFEVVGVALLPATPHTDFDEGGWTTAEGLARVATTEQWKFRLVYVRVRDGADLDAVKQRFAAATGNSLEDFQPPTMLYNLKTIRTVPLTLAVFLAILAIGAVGHALATAVRRRRGEMAVIRSLGMTRGQARWSVVVQATTLAAVGILIGVPLGIVAGQLVWRSLADAVPFVYERPWAMFAVLLAPLAAIVISNLLAAVPARRAARLAPAEVLRAE